MNKKLFLIYLLFNIFCINSFSNDKVDSSAPQKASKYFRLERVQEHRVLRSNLIPYIEVNEQSIKIVDIDKLYNATLEIFNEYGESVYRTVVNLDANECLSISIGDWEQGAYSIYFKNNKDQTIIYGAFEL